MFLYLVTCVCKSVRGIKETLDVYVVAQTSKDAENGAIDLMKSLGYKYQDYVGKIEILASVNTYKADRLLVIIK